MFVQDVAEVAPNPFGSFRGKNRKLPALFPLALGDTAPCLREKDLEHVKPPE